MLSEDDDKRDQRRLLEMIQARDGKITVRQLMQGSRIHRESAEVANSALQELVDIGWGSWETIQTGSDGGRPSRIFVLNSEAGGNKTPDDRPEQGFVTVTGKRGFNNE
jgi:hypothetical protein